MAQNFWGAPIVCQGQLWARTYYHGDGWLNVVLGPIYPGTYGYAYLNAPYGDAFVAAHANLYCRWF